MFYIYTLLLLTVITGCFSDVCNKGAPGDLFGSERIICPVGGCCGPVGGQHCCINFGLLMGLVMGTFFVVMLTVVVSCICYGKYKNKKADALAFKATTNGYNPQLNGYSTASPNISYMANTNGTISYSNSSGLYPNSDFSQNSTLSNVPTLSQ